MPREQLALALSQEDPELSPSGEEIKPDGSQVCLRHSHHPLPCLLSECHLILWSAYPITSHQEWLLSAERFCPDLAT